MLLGSATGMVTLEWTLGHVPVRESSHPSPNESLWIEESILILINKCIRLYPHAPTHMQITLHMPFVKVYVFQSLLFTPSFDIIIMKGYSPCEKLVKILASISGSEMNKC